MENSPALERAKGRNLRPQPLKLVIRKCPDIRRRQPKDLSDIENFRDGNKTRP
jgi:hypothetical protein